MNPRKKVQTNTVMNKKGLERLQALMNEISEWSDEQFNEGVFNHERSLPIAHHLKKESEELIEALSIFFSNRKTDDFSIKIENIGEELADVFMLILDCATHMGYDSDDLVTAAFNKLEVNRGRKWGKPDKNGVVEHIKNNESLKHE